MIIVTGAAGFIGSNLVRGLNARGIDDILAVDDLTEGAKFRNLADLRIADYRDWRAVRADLRANRLGRVEAVFHQGACSDTTERDGRYMMDTNYASTHEWFDYCQLHAVPLVYASSAAVYGAGPRYAEDPACEAPLNVYGYSKLLFDQVLRRHMSHLSAPVVGLRYFNVYGPREQHKGRMASVAYHNLCQRTQGGPARLFGGWDGYADGAQARDFVFVEDVVRVNLHFLEHAGPSGIFNCGTGRAQTFNDVAHTVINTLRELADESPLALAEQAAQGLLQYVPFPDDLKGRYQSHTEADLTALRAAGYDAPFCDVQTGVAQYVRTLHAAGLPTP